MTALLLRTFCSLGVLLVMMLTRALAQPVITGGSAFVVGQNRTLICYINVVGTPQANPLSWSVNGIGLTSTKQLTIQPISSVTSYQIEYNFIVRAADNLAVFKCTDSLSSIKNVASWTLYVYQPPGNPIITGPTSVVGGSSSTWGCEVDKASASAPVVRWHFGNGTGIPSSHYFSVENIYTDNATMLDIHGVTSHLTLNITLGAPSFGLRCHVIHFDTGSNRDTTVSVTVNYPPQVSGSGSNYTVTSGQPITLTCTVNANPSVTSLTWYKDGETLNTTSSRYTGGTPQQPSLTINPSVRGDAGNYKCGAINSIGSAISTSSYLTVRYSPVITYSQNPVSGVLNSDVTISCLIDAVPPYTNVYWYRAGSTVVIDVSSSKYSGGTASTSPNLTIHNLNSDDEGPYRCRADNDVGVGEGVDVTLEVNYPPRITVVASETATEPQAVTLTCTVDAQPAATSLTWYKGGQVLTTSDTSVYSGGTATSPNLTILSVSKADADSYYCVALNSVGDTTSDTITLTVRYFPIITVPQSEVGGQLGGSVTLTVSIDANPALDTIQWQHVGQSESTETTIDVLGGRYSGGTLSSPSLVISSLVTGDMGNYTVVATNDVGTRQAVIIVAVSYAPTTPTVTYDTSGYKEGQQVSLTCSSSGFPQPQYRWYHNSQQLTTFTSSILTIPSASPSNKGQYRCEAYNNQGTASTSVTVVIFYKPRAGAISNATVSIGQTVTLTCQTDANPAPTIYNWTHNGVSLGEASTSLQRTVTVTNSSFLGRYDCQATNQEGTSDPISIYIKLQGDSGGGDTGQSTEDSGLSTTTLILIIIIGIIILIVIILLIVFCCASGRCACNKKDNNVAPSPPPPAVTPYTSKPLSQPADSKPNGHVASSASHVGTTARTTTNGISNGRINLEDDKTGPPLMANGTASLGHGLSISVPGGMTPRPHHLPPLGQDGVPEETESARDDKPRKKKRRRERGGGDASHSPKHDSNM